MNQENIGRFIAELRKEKKLTQAELALRLGITDRAVSKWENGRGLPDISLLEPLCNELSVTINELLCGERLEPPQIPEKAEENIISTLKMSDRKIKNTKIIFFSILGLVLAILIFLCSAFAIDINRMRNNQPVVFSTWGFGYAPPIELNEEEIERAIKRYILSHADSQPTHHENEKAFTAFRTFLLEETEKESKYTVYTWVLTQRHYPEDNEIKKDSGSSIPTVFYVEKSDGEFIVTDSRTPRDSPYYEEDMKAIFPLSVRRDMDRFYTDGSYERLEMEIEEQLELYFHTEE